MLNNAKKLAIPLLFALVLAGCNSATAPVNTNQAPGAGQQITMNIPDQINQSLSGQYSGATLVTNYGSIEVAFYPESPITVSNFLTLAQAGFYDGTLFHRVIKDFMIQGGDPNSKNANWATHGQGGPGYKFSDEINNHALVRGSLAMANAGPDTNGSQFFIVTAAQTAWLDGKHTNFGYVVKGMDIVEKIEAVQTDQNDHPLQDVKIEKIELIKK